MSLEEAELLQVRADDSELSSRVAHETGIKKEQASQILAMVGANYSGPIPPTSELTKLNEMEPGLGTRLVQDHLTQRQHDRSCDTEALRLASEDSTRNDLWLRYANRGQWFGICSLGAFLLAALVALYFGHPTVAAIFVSPAILGAISKFIQSPGRGPAEKSDEA